jgi:hypothetical protein
MIAVSLMSYYDSFNNNHYFGILTTLNSMPFTVVDSNVFITYDSYQRKMRGLFIKSANVLI